MPSTQSDAEPDDYLVGHLQDALAEQLNELDVQITLAGGGVYLDGVVLTEERRDAVGDVVRRQIGDRPVHNQVTVAPLDAPTQVEEIR